MSRLAQAIAFPRHRTSSIRLALILMGAMSVGLRGASANGAPPGQRQALIEQALGETTRITLEDVALKDAIQRITEQTGVEIVMPPAVMSLVPDGPETIIRKVHIANVSLRQGLTDLFGPLGMTFVVRDGFVEIVASEALKCLGRVPNWVELRTIEELGRMKVGTDPKALEELRPKIQFQVRIAEPWAVLAEAVRGVGAGTGDEVLSIACDKLGWAWCVSDDRVVITLREQDIIRRLKQPISVRLSRQPLFDAMTAVGEAVGVAVRAEPGALAALAPSVQRNFSLDVRGQSAEQALETIAAYTGLGYLVEPTGVLFYQVSNERVSSRENERAGGSSGARDPYVGKVVVELPDGVSMEWLIRSSELPDDLRVLRERDLAVAFEAVRLRGSK